MAVETFEFTQEGNKKCYKAESAILNDRRIQQSNSIEQIAATMQSWLIDTRAIAKDFERKYTEILEFPHRSELVAMLKNFNLSFKRYKRFAEALLAINLVDKAKQGGAPDRLMFSMCECAEG